MSQYIAIHIVYIAYCCKIVYKGIGQQNIQYSENVAKEACHILYVHMQRLHIVIDERIAISAKQNNAYQVPFLYIYSR